MSVVWEDGARLVLILLGNPPDVALISSVFNGRYAMYDLVSELTRARYLLLRLELSVAADRERKK